MKKVNLKFIISTIILLLLVALTTNVFAATGSLTVSFVPDVSNAIRTKEVSVTLSLSNFNNVDTSLPMAATGNLEYDDSIFSNVTIEGLNGWSATLSQENKILLESPTSSNITEGGIALITLTINGNVTTFGTDITINSLGLTNDDGMGEGEPNIDISNMSLTARASVNSSNEDIDNDNNNPDTPSEDPSTEDPNEDPNGNTDNGQGGNNQENPNDQENNENEDENENQQENNNETTTDGVKKPEANSIGQVGDLTVAKDPIPQTGVSYIALGIIALVIIIGLIAFWRYKKFVRLMNKGV